MSELRELIRDAIWRHTGSPLVEDYAESVIKAIEASGRVTVDRATPADFSDDALDAFTAAISAEVELSGGTMGGSHPRVFACHAISWLEDAGFKLVYFEPGDLDPLP